MNFKYSCVPRGSTRAMYSAPMIATANASGLRFSVETMTSPPGLTSAANAADDGRRIRNVLEHFHAGHQIEGRRPFAAPAPRPRRLDIRHRHLALERMQFRHIEHRLRQIDAEHRGAGARHRLAQDAAAAAHVEHARAAQSSPRARCSADAAGLSSCSGLDGPGGIPPALRQRAEFREFSRIGISCRSIHRSPSRSSFERPSAWDRAATSDQSRRVSSPPESSWRPGDPDIAHDVTAAAENQLRRADRPAAESPGRRRSTQHRSAHLPVSSVPTSPSSPQDRGAAVQSPRASASHADAASTAQQLSYSPQMSWLSTRRARAADSERECRPRRKRRDRGQSRCRACRLALRAQADRDAGALRETRYPPRSACIMCTALSAGVSKPRFHRRSIGRTPCVGDAARDFARPIRAGRS